jgi:hypothetical protein
MAATIEQINGPLLKGRRYQQSFRRRGGLHIDGQTYLLAVGLSSSVSFRSYRWVRTPVGFANTNPSPAIGLRSTVPGLLIFSAIL